ncbi:hypothetical protein AFLA70_521g000681 [Aspergillus flavus AF70]|nr:hypothetical protein AFLA70_521g000681 [Aspergillus flavus AF70]
MRYQASADAPVRYGSVSSPRTQADGIASLAETGQLQLKVCDDSDPFTDLLVTGQVERVHRLLGPLAPESVRIIRCIGLNYRSPSHLTIHPPTDPPIDSTVQYPLTIHQSSRRAVPSPPGQRSSPSPPPPFPTTTTRCRSPGPPRTDATMRDIAHTDALDHVAGYTVANDISPRDWQRQPGKAGPVLKWTFGKSFDRYAPLGPCIVSPAVLGQGQTLQKGLLIMTGTPGGVGLFIKPPGFLKHGNEVCVRIGGIGALRNTIQFL